MWRVGAVAAADVSDGLRVDEGVLKAVEAKERGNGSFKGGENAEACQAYQLAAQYLRRHSEVPAAKEVLLSVQTNLAAAQLRLRRVFAFHAGHERRPLPPQGARQAREGRRACGGGLRQRLRLGRNLAAAPVGNLRGGAA